MKKSKILHLCNYTWEVGGPSSVILHQAIFQDKFFFENIVLSTISENQKPYSQNNIVRVFYFCKSRFSAILPDFSWGIFFWFYKNYSSFDIIQIHGLWNFGSILPFLFKKKTKIILTIHGFLDPYVLNDSKFKKLLFWFFFHRWQLKNIDVIHVISEDEKKIAEKWFPQIKSKIEYVPNGFDLPLTKEKVCVNFRKTIDNFRNNSICTYLFIGRLHEKKGLIILIEAFKSLIVKNGKLAKLIIAGPDDGLLKYLKNEISGMDNILLLPSISGANKDFLLESAEVFILPSYSEGFSIAALEAIAYGKSCIFSWHVGFSKLALKNNAALICETNSNSLCNEMEKLLFNVNLRGNLGKKARQLYTTYFTNDIVGKQFFNQVILK